MIVWAVTVAGGKVQSSIGRSYPAPTKVVQISAEKDLASRHSIMLKDMEWSMEGTYKCHGAYFDKDVNCRTFEGTATTLFVTSKYRCVVCFI